MAMAEASEERSRRSGFRIGRIAGIDIRIDLSWFLIFLLVFWSIAAGYLPLHVPGLRSAAYVLAGLLAALLFFASIVVHELAHSLVAIRSGISIQEITLFLFGGVSRMRDDPPSPGVELRIALAGPLASFALAALFGALDAALGARISPLARVVLEYLAGINFALGVFNLMPGFPLDGGRVLRAAAWWKTGSRRRATRLASNIGQGFAVALMVLGGVEIATGALLGGLWLLFIGMFLRSMAAAGYEQLVLRSALDGMDVADVMVRDPLRVSPRLSVEDLLEQHFLRDAVRAYPVVDEAGALRGVVSLGNLGKLPRERFAALSVGEVMDPISDALQIDAGASLADAVERMAAERLERLLVLRDGALVGLLTRGSLERFLELGRVLGPARVASGERRPPRLERDLHPGPAPA